jgi:superkiller protein 3
VKKNVTALVLCAAVWVAPAALSPARAGRAADVRTTAFRNLGQGVSLYKKGEYKQAIEKLEAAANAALNNFRAHYYLALAYIGDRQYAKALETLEIALDLDPGHLMSHIAVGDAYLKMGDLEEAKAAYYRGLKLRPAFPPALDGLARVYEAQSDDEQAISYYRQAIASDRGYAAAYTHLGDLYLRQNRFEEAVLLLEEAVAIRPDYAPGLNRLALAYGRLGLDNQAVATIQQAIELEPNSARHPATLGELELVKGYLTAAEVSFHNALVLDPALPEARLGLAEVARRRGEYKTALAELDVALADERIGPLTERRLTGFRQLIEDEMAEAERLRAVVDAGEATPADHEAIALILAGRGRWEEAAEQQRQADDSDEGRERLAYMLFQAGRYGDAHRLYAELAESTGGAEMSFNNGVTLALLGDDRAAVEAYDRTLQLDPEHLGALLYLGNARLRLGEEDEAVGAYRRYLVKSDRGEAAERVRRILRQLAPDAIPEVPDRPPRPPAQTEATPGEPEGKGETGS